MSPAILSFLALLWLLAGSLTAMAQGTCAGDVEPNDRPETAQPFAGAFCLDGSISDSDQEIVAWTVDAASAAVPWTIRARGPRGLQTRVQIHALEEPGDAENPAIVGPELMALVTAPGADAVERSNVYLTPGNWLVGISASAGDGGAYHVEFVPGQASDGSAGAGNATAQSAVPVPSVFELRGTLVGKDAWYAWRLAGIEARKRWTLTATAPLGAEVGFELRTTDGRPLLASTRIAEGRLELPDIGLPEGTYLVRLSRTGEVAYPFSLTSSSQGPRSPGREEEPNDTPLTARPLALGQPMNGRISQPGDVDRYVLPAKATSQLLSIQAAGESRAVKRLCVGNAAGDLLQCREGEAPSLTEVAVGDTSRFVTVSGGADPRASYELTARISGVVRPDGETEPNDTAVAANALATPTARGRLSGDDTDMYRFEVADAKLHHFAVTGDGVGTIEVVDGQNQSSARADRALDAEAKPAPGPLELKDLALQPGTYYLAVSGRDGGDYEIASNTTEPVAIAADTASEREPNDDAERAQLLLEGQRVSASLEGSTDADSYRLSLHDEQGLAIAVESGNVCPLELVISWESWSGAIPKTTGAAIRYPARLRPGEYSLRVGWSVDCKEQRVPYTIGYADDRQMPEVGDVEPNDAFNLGRPLPPGMKVSGTVGQFSDDDWYSLPAVDAATEMTLKTTGDVEVALTDGKATSSAMMSTPNELASGYGGAPAVGTVPAGAAAAVRIRGKGDYTLDVAMAGAAAAAPPASAPPAPNAPPAENLTAALAFNAKEVAAFWHRGQRLAGTLTLTNPGTAPAEVDLKPERVPAGWRLELPPTASIPPGNTAVPVSLIVEPDAYAARAAAIEVAAVSKGARAAAKAELAVAIAAEPVGDHLAFNLPGELLGGFNVAWTALGGQLMPDPKVDESEDPQLVNDGLGSNAGFLADAAKLPLAFTVRFGGGRAWPIRGITINPQTPGIWPSEYIRDFELLVSRDGQSFEPALRGAVTPEPREQSFLLPQPMEVAAAQLRVLNNHDGNLGRVGLSEWKVIADPAAGIGVALDIADTARGGHIVWSQPQVSDQVPEIKGVLEQGGPGPLAAAPAGMRPQLTLGFNEDRAAQITSIEWTESALDPYARYWPGALVEASTETPFGPWVPLGEIRPAGEGRSTLALKQPSWARFLRFTAVEASPENGTKYQFPTGLTVLERASDAGYRSILGEWGQYSPASFYETTLPREPPSRAEGDANDTRERAEPLAMEEVVSGRVEIGKDEDWYRIAQPDGLDMLVVTLGGEPTVDADVELHDAAGKPLPLTEIEGSPRRAAFEARVEPGATYYLRVLQPPHSVVIAYDTSGSLLAFIPIIFNALDVFAAGVTPGREAVNFLPFDGTPMLKDFSDQPAVLLQALAKDARESTTSGLEGSAITAMRELAARRGTRALLVVTDAASSTVGSQTDMWEMLEQVRPRVFSAHAGSFDDPLREKQVLEDMSMASGGHYASSRSQGELDVAFDRVAAWLRRPAGYSLSVAARKAAPSEPGAIEVSGSAMVVANVEAPAETPPGNAIEMVFDASGSMLKRMEGKRRIEIARNSLSKLVSETLKPGDPVALRVFGNDKPGSCETSLMQPLGPLDPGSVTSLISAIEPQNLAKTPIAASLSAVAEDLADAAGRKTVILITDGEETCGGDPRAAIQALAEKDFEVRVNIVGFAVDDPALKGEFAEWARIGRGRYFDATKAEDLDAAVKAATELPFKITDPSGALVAAGSVGGPAVGVPAGSYRVEVASTPPRVFEGVVVREKETTRVEMGGA